MAATVLEEGANAGPGTMPSEDRTARLGGSGEYSGGLAGIEVAGLHPAKNRRDRADPDPVGGYRGASRQRRESVEGIGGFFTEIRKPLSKSFPVAPRALAARSSNWA
jgi:hypothetical protein